MTNGVLQQPPVRYHHSHMASNTHDTLAFRLAQILVKLNQGEKLDPQSLAEEFGVNLRTIQRDLNCRFAYLPLIKSGGLYYLDRAFLGQLSTKDIERFAQLAGIRGLFPSLSDDFLRDIFDSRLQSALLVKGHHYEDISGKAELFRQLEGAIVNHKLISFDYQKADEKKHYASLEPYKVINQKGIWYLACRDAGKLKTFSLTKLHRLDVLEQDFFPDPAVAQNLLSEDGVWISDEKREIVLKIAKDVAAYFKRRKLIANQVIEKELEDGGLIVSAKIGHPNQILPIVRYWIPHVRIISPEEVQVQMENDLQNYLSQ